MESTVNDVIQSHISRVFKDLDDQIIEAIKDTGHEFQSEDELRQFCKDRCEMTVYAGNLRELRIDGKPVVQWCDTSKCSFDPENLLASIEVGFNKIIQKQ